MRGRAPESNLEWKKWGEKDPLWGVAAWQGKEKNGASPWTDDEFYRLGEADWQDFFDHWKMYGVDTRSCLEIGCGAGRLTLPNSRTFEQTIAVDVSEGMLDYARQHVASPSVTFQLVDGIQLPCADGSVSAIFSAHVFQHFDTLEYATSYFAEILRALAPGGSMMIHLPICEWPYLTPRLSRRIYDWRIRLEDAKAWVRRRLLERGLSRQPIMRALSYPLQYFYYTLPRLGFEQMEIMIFPVKSNGGYHPFVLARKKS
ncbi:MAG: class I SAM-dependent methyltransferase [Chloroflexi bacterium]|nr:MAG: class I SAM-dependent methyltransferase [Chloroflexota bacterium]